MPYTTSITTRNTYNVFLEPTIAAVVTDEYELRPFKKYTINSSALSGSEEITVEILDQSTSEWQELKIGGDTVKLAHKYEMLLFSDIGMIIRFNKSSTASPVGITITYD